MSELSRRLMVTSGNVTAIVDQLISEGLVERFDDPEDRRAIRIRLTPTGSQWFASMAREHEFWIVGLLGELNATERSSLYPLLARVKTAALNSEMALLL